MSGDSSIFEEQFKIRASEVGPDQKATLPAICNLLQEIAGNHARQLHFDITDLQENKRTWVLHRLQVEMERYPQWRETITIHTWPSGLDGLRALRDFLILDADKQIIGRSLSYWLILDMENRRPVRISKEILNSVPKDREHVLPITKRDFSEVKKPDGSQSFNVRKSDLDFNRHVNNVRYVEWALACLPHGEQTDNISIKFLGEAVMGDKVTAAYTSGSANKYFQIKRPSDQKVLALALAT